MLDTKDVNASELTGSEPWFLDVFGPVTEERTTYDLQVRGAIPEQLTGRYLRNGPNPAALPSGRYHWFFGDGMVHGVELRGSRATWYRNRFVRTGRASQALGVPAPSGAPEVNPLNPANTNIIKHAGHFLAWCEVGLPYELTAELETIGAYDFRGRLASPVPATPSSTRLRVSCSSSATRRPRPTFATTRSIPRASSPAAWTSM